jgi:hypothetical protein
MLVTVVEKFGFWCLRRSTAPAITAAEDKIITAPIPIPSGTSGLGFALITYGIYPQLFGTSGLAGAGGQD